MDLDKTSLAQEFYKVALRYEQKSAAIVQSILFITEADLEAREKTPLREVINNFEKYLKPHSLNFHSYFFCQFLVSLISEAEIYFVDVLRILINKYPFKLGNISFKLSEILDLSKEELITKAAEDYLNRLTYKKPIEYLEDLINTLSIDKESIYDFWPIFAEAKARRDVGIHNNWLINDIYKRKVIEVGLEPTQGENDLLIPDSDYLISTIKTCDQIIHSIHKQLIVKYS